MSFLVTLIQNTIDMLSSHLPALTEWAPFQLDALGLVTIFGSKEMNTAVGNLVSSSTTEYLPVLAAYTVANNEIIQPEPGYVLYNISDGIMATDVAAWFTRWLTTFPLTYTATTIRLRSWRKERLSRAALKNGLGVFVGLVTFGLLMAMAVVTADAWGVANVVAMMVSVLARQLVVHQLRCSIDDAIDELDDDLGEDVKVFLTLPNGKAVTIYGPRMLVVRCLLTDAKPTRPTIYHFSRMICWAAFGAHAITLGMSSLFNQILTVVVLLLGTYLTASHVGDCPEEIGTRLKLDVDMGDPDLLRGPAYKRLDMNETEEECMVHWSMMPQRSNVWWWERYREGQLPSQIDKEAKSVCSSA
ncbi:hypothetical protein BDV18DRAFT_83388 [Aspergillus unguis]